MSASVARLTASGNPVLGPLGVSGSLAAHEAHEAREVHALQEAPRVRPTPAPPPPGAKGVRGEASVASNAATGPANTLRRPYLVVLGWAFTLFSSVRIAAYLPTVWAIFSSGDSSQHSLWTWCTWFGANLTMALWLRERNGGHFDRAAAVNLGNAAMCGLTLLLIVWFRL